MEPLSGAIWCNLIIRELEIVLLVGVMEQTAELRRRLLINMRPRARTKSSSSTRPSSFTSGNNVSAAFSCTNQSQYIINHPNMALMEPAHYFTATGTPMSAYHQQNL